MKAMLKSFWDGGQKRRFEEGGFQDKLIGVIAIVMSIYQLWQATFSSIQPLLHYSIHLTFVLVLCYLYYTPRMGADRKKFSIMDGVIAALIAAAGIYYALHVPEYTTRWPQVDPLPTVAVIVAVLFMILIIDGTRRTMGMVLPLIAIIFLLYTVFGHYLPGGLYHRYIKLINIIDQCVFTTNGIFTSPIACSSTYVFLFCLFGAFFTVSGAGDFFYKFSMAVAGQYTGGAGKVAVVASGLFGMINGSPTANVATTGSFTIPMMKKVGYDGEFSAAISAVASTGGGILPPIMGTAAFLMVEMAGIPYRDIAIAAAIPGILYYVSLSFMVHFRAKKDNLPRLSKEDLPPVGATLKEGFPFVIPLILLIAMILMGYTASMSAVAGIIAVVVVSWFRKETRMGPKKILKALRDGALSSVIVSLSCAVAGMVICGLMTTGLGGKIASLIISLGGSNILSALFLTALLCTILGMGMPVAAAYALTVSLAVPSLIDLGISVMSAHLFVVYFSTLSAITPPVAVASYAAAGIAEGNANRIGWKSCKIGIVSFILPFVFVLEPSMLTVLTEFSFKSIQCVITATIGTICLCGALEGWLLRRMDIVTRLMLGAGSFCLLLPGSMTDIIGVALIAAVVIFEIIQNKKDGPKAAVAVTETVRVETVDHIEIDDEVD